MKLSKLVLLFSLIIFINCSKSKKMEAEKKVYVEINVDKAEIVHNGSIVSVSPFQILDKNRRPIAAKKEGTGIAYINLLNPEIKSLGDKDLEVTNDSVVILVVDCQKKSVGYKLHNKKGFTKTQIVSKLNEIYRKIYGAEQKETKIDSSIFKLRCICVFENNNVTYLIPNCEW